MNGDIYQTITDRFIDQLKKGTVPWQMPWRGVQNIVSRKPYRGINSLLLGATEFQSPFWLTFKQTLDLGGHVKKGAKSSPVIYYKFLEKTDTAGNPVRGDDGTPKRIPFVRWSNVFNLDQTEGIEPPAITRSQNDLSANDRAAGIVQVAKLCPIHHTGFAHLAPSRRCNPHPAHASTARKATITPFHEMTYATGHGRADREASLTRRSMSGIRRGVDCRTEQRSFPTRRAFLVACSSKTQRRISIRGLANWRTTKS
jgi:antirestriction protein ArdC